MPQWIADAGNAAAEYTLARKIVEKEAESPRWPSIDSPAFESLTKHQRHAVEGAMQGAVSLLGGYAGSGKSYSTVAIIKALLRHVDAGAIAICAPTGKASVRLMEIMNGYELDLPATTIHSLLGVQVKDGQFSFFYDEDNPLPHRYVFVDEFSMADTSLAASLLAACGSGTQIMHIGDPGQLAPVGHGAPLRDMTRVGMPCGILEEIHRNAGSIVEACHKVRRGEMFEFPDEFKPFETPPLNLKHINCGMTSALAKIKAVLTRLGDLGSDPVWDAQCIVALNEQGKASRKYLNRELQAFLNPDGRSIPQSPFRVGDKVIQTKNTYMADARASASDEDGNRPVHMISNGDIGEVLVTQPKMLHVKFRYPDRTVIVPRSPEPEETGCALDLALAITGHKMQGSSAKFPLIVLDDSWSAVGPSGICSRQWLYTAMTRGETADFLFGTLPTMQKMVRKESIENRQTMLIPMIQKLRRDRDVPTSLAM